MHSVEKPRINEYNIFERNLYDPLNAKRGSHGKICTIYIKTSDDEKIHVKITRMKEADAVQTEKEPARQTSWTSDYIQDKSFEKYALKTDEGELVALAAYEILKNDVMVHITYIESQPESNPTIVGHSKKYNGIGVF